MPRCAHCHTEFGSTIPNTKRFISKLAGATEDEVVEISDAVKRIFEWKCNGKRKYKVEKKLVVCHECGICIGKLYSAMHLFDYLMKPESYMCRGILRDQAELDISRYREEMKRKSKEMMLSSDYSQTSPMSKNKKWSSNSFKTRHSEYDAGSSTCPQKDEEEDEESEIIFGRDDDADGTSSTRTTQQYVLEDGDEDESFSPLGNAKVVMSSLRTKSELVTPVILGIDDDPPSPRASMITPVPDLENKKFICKLCPKGFGTNQGLRTHLLLTHEVGNKTKEHKCENCDKSFFYEYLLKNHAKVHSSEKPVECPICPSRFKTKLAMIHHQKNVHAASDRPFRCCECGKCYKEARSLREHINITHNASGPTFICKYGCGSTTSRKRSMLSHLRRCRYRPGFDENQIEPPRRGVRGRLLYPMVTKELSSSPNEISRIPCRWGCGKIFKDKKMAMRHNVYDCTKRPPKPTIKEEAVESSPQSDLDDELS